MKTVNINSLSEFLQKQGKPSIERIAGWVEQGKYNIMYLADGIRFQVEIPEVTDAPIGFNKSAGRIIIEKQIYYHLKTNYESSCDLFFGKVPEFEDFKSSPENEKNFAQLIQSIGSTVYGPNWQSKK